MKNSKHQPLKNAAKLGTQAKTTDPALVHTAKKHNEVPEHKLKSLPKVARPPVKLWDSIRYYAIGLYNNLDDDHCFLLASGIAFNVLSSIIPLSLLLFEVFSVVLRSNKDAGVTIIAYITDAIPVAEYQLPVHEWLKAAFISAAHAGHTAGIIGGFTLLWLASALFSTLRTTVNAIFRMKPKRNAIILKLGDFVMMSIVTVLLLALTLLSPLTVLLLNFGKHFLPDFILTHLNTALPYFIGLGLSVVLYGILFRFLPHSKPNNKVVLVSTLTTVILLELMKQIFSFYMSRISSIGALYGAYAFLVGIALWVYYMAAVFTIGAEVGWLYHDRAEKAKAELKAAEAVG